MEDEHASAEVVPLSAWQGEQIRLTAFTHEPVTLSKAVEWFADVTGIQPGRKQEANAPGQPQVIVAQGEWAEGLLTLQSQPGRIDWFFTPSPSAPSTGMFTLMPQPQKKVEVIRRVESWLKKQNEIQRLAFGLIVMEPKDTQDAANKRLQGFLGDNVKISTEVRDFIYQVNHPAPSKVLDKPINRIAKWMVLSVRPMQFSITPMGMVPMQKAGAEYVACRLEIDINTHIDLTPSQLQANLSAVFTELVDMGLALLKTGDFS